MEQLTLPGPGQVPLPVSGPSPASHKSGVRLRPYQAVRAGEGLSLILAGKNPLLEMATGTGKTATAAEIMRALLAMGWRQLWIAHRIELVRQAKEAIEKATGIAVGQELPGYRSFAKHRIVVASKDTVRTIKRLDRIRQDGLFHAIFTDEAHHSPGQSYQGIYRAFPEAIRVGLTATGDRLDKKGLDNYDAKVSPYTIIDGITDGWLVPFLAKRVKVRSVDLSTVATVAGDFNQGQLEQVISAESVLHGIAQGLVQNAGDRPTIVFASGVDSAERLTEILNRYKKGSARFVSGSTDPDARTMAFQNFGRNYQYLVNVGVATEGTDLPAAACIAMARPTQSRSLFCQMLGRGGRPLPGLDLLGDDAKMRRLWIAASYKPDCLVLDFVGNAGKHSVVTVADVIGADAKISARAIKAVNDAIDSGTAMSVLEVLQAEAGREQDAVKRREKVQEQKVQERAALIATVTLDVKETALIGLGGLPDDMESALDLSAAPSPGQVEQAQILGVQLPAKCDRRKARFMITEARNKLGRATIPQLELIRKHRPELATAELSKAQAQGLIGRLIQRWKGGRYGYRNRHANGSGTAGSGTGSGEDSSGQDS